MNGLYTCVWLYVASQMTIDICVNMIISGSIYYYFLRPIVVITLFCSLFYDRDYCICHYSVVQGDHLFDHDLIISAILYQNMSASCILVSDHLTRTFF